MQRKVCGRILVLLKLRNSWSVQWGIRKKATSSNIMMFLTVTIDVTANASAIVKALQRHILLFTDLVTNLRVCKYTCDTFVFEYGNAFFTCYLFHTVEWRAIRFLCFHKNGFLHLWPQHWFFDFEVHKSPRRTYYCCWQTDINRIWNTRNSQVLAMSVTLYFVDFPVLTLKYLVKFTV